MEQKKKQKEKKVLFILISHSPPYSVFETDCNLITHILYPLLVFIVFKSVKYGKQ